MKTSYKASLLAISLLLEGCYINQAIWDPFGQVPPTPGKSWEAPQRAKKTTAFELEIPSEEAPLTLAEIIDIALRNNTKTWQTWAEARVSAASYAQTQSSALPQIDGSFTVSRLRFSTTFNNQIETFLQSQWGPGMSLSYIVFDFGQRKATSEAARQALYFADWTHNWSIQTVIDTITNDYYDYLYQKELLLAYTADVATAKTVLDSAVLGFKTGVKDVSDVLQAKTDYLQTQTRFVIQQQAVNTTYSNLLTDMGIGASTKIQVEPLPENLPQEEVEKNVSAVIDSALKQRADLLAAESAYRSADQTVLAASRQFFPTLQYNFDFGRTYFSGGVNDDYYFASTFGLSIPIFHGFNLQNALRKARAQREVTEAQLREKQLKVIEDVTVAHYNVTISYETLSYAESFLEAAEEQFDVAITEYRQGTTDIINVSFAQSSLADARAQKAQAVRKWFTSLANLAYASGTLGPPNQPTDPEP